MYVAVAVAVMVAWGGGVGDVRDLLAGLIRID